MGAISGIKFFSALPAMLQNLKDRILNVVVNAHHDLL
jgi:hypothetical protein